MNYEDLTKRIERAEKAAKNQAVTPEWWQGYIGALNDIRNEINTGGKT